MENNEIYNLVISQMKDQSLWFTTKNDPTFEEPSYYIELDEYGDPTEKAVNKIVEEVKNYIGDGAVDVEEAVNLFINDQLMAYRISYIDNLVTNFEDKPVVDQIEAYENPVQLTESVKTNLKEESTQSLKLIGDKLSDPEFDPDSKAGQIVLKTSELFNQISDKDFDASVSFDNGDSQITILLGQTGGQVNITINDASQPVKAFLSGNMEINNYLLDDLRDILDITE